MKTTLLNWRREPRDIGLAHVTQGWRGYILRLGGKDGVDVGYVCPVVTSRHDTSPTKFYWYAHVNDRSMNTSTTPVDSVKAAQDACKAWVREELKRGTDDKSL